MIDLTKFPSVMKKGFKEHGLSFSADVESEYEPLNAYRKITRKNFENCIITKDDFKSYPELGKPAPRGRNIGIGFYSCSLNTSLDEIRVMFKFPGENKGIAEGYVKKENGPKLGPNNGHGHVDWWLYENAEPEKDFVFLEGGINNE